MSGQGESNVIPLKKKGVGRKGSGGTGGAPPHQPTEQTRNLVKLGKTIGYTNEQIARLVQVSENTLKKYYGEELESGSEQINARIAANLATIASSQTHKQAVTAAIFWTKARMGWSEKTAVDAPSFGNISFTIQIGSAGPPPKMIDG